MRILIATLAVAVLAGPVAAHPSGHSHAVIAQTKGAGIPPAIPCPGVLRQGHGYCVGGYVIGN